MEDAHCRDVEEVASYFSVDPNKGLSDFEVSKARARYGRNELAPEAGVPLWKLILKQFDDLLVKILLAAAVVDLIVALTNGESFWHALLEPSVILVILVANATVGVVTERNAEKAIEELKAYEAEAASVLRGGQMSVIPAAELVPGDVVEIAVGNQIPADIRLVEVYSNMLRVDQSVLTGESNSVVKTTKTVGNPKAVYQDKICILFSGTMVTSGRARGIVVGTGSNTAIGKIRDAMSDQDDVVTPLKAKLDEFGTLLSKIIAGICILVWIMNINRFKDPALGGWVSGAIYYFKIAVALAVAAIPEGLPAVVTTCLALGTRKMAQQNAIVRTLPSVETLGCTTVICSDKTGTLTTNMMSVVKACVVASANQLAEFDITGTTYAPDGVVLGRAGVVMRCPADSPCLFQSAMCAALCNDSTLAYSPATNTYQRIGEATELALRVFAEKIGLPSSFGPALKTKDTLTNKHWTERFKRVALLEFSRDRKMMSVLCSGDGRSVMLTKGAPESVLSRCTTALANNGDGVVPLTDSMRHQVAEVMESYGRRNALRCLGLAFKTPTKTMDQITPADEEGLTFLGLVGMHDPPRAECRSAVETCHAAGIRVVVVTGDNKGTAEAVARQVGALPPTNTMHGDGIKGLSLTGVEFDELSGVAQSEAVGSMHVFSRVEPLHKLRLVELLKAQGHVVAMTGDGVNDAPALMKADIGVAMGSGTAVAKHAADMVLADDNFATIVSAVAEGRAIYNNTKQFIRYMISSNIGEVVAIFVAALLGIPEVLSPVQLLWVNLVTDGLPATALGFNKPDKDIMTRPPRRIDEPIVNGWLFIRYVVVGMYVGLATAIGFIWWFLWFQGGPRLSWSQLSSFQKCVEAQAKSSGYSCAVFSDESPKTISMSVLVVVEMFNALNNLSEDTSLLVIPPWDNKWLLGAISTSMALHLLILYFPPAAALFSVTPLNGAEWAMVLWLSAPVILVDEVMKYLSRHIVRHVRGTRQDVSVMRTIDIDGGKEANSKWH